MAETFGVVWLILWSMVAVAGHISGCRDINDVTGEAAPRLELAPLTQEQVRAYERMKA